MRELVTHGLDRMPKIRMSTSLILVLLVGPAVPSASGAGMEQLQTAAEKGECAIRYEGKQELQLRLLPLLTVCRLLVSKKWFNYWIVSSRTDARFMPQIQTEHPPSMWRF